jgi:hypothetical protein
MCVDNPVGLVAREDYPVLLSHASGDCCEISVLEHVDVVRQRVVQAEHPPLMRELQSPPALCLGQYIATQILTTAHITKKRLKTIKPIWEEKKGKRE